MTTIDITNNYIIFYSDGIEVAKISANIDGINVNNNKLINVDEPSEDNDVANKLYVDNATFLNTIHRNKTDNPHTVTKEQLGLGFVSNIKHNLAAPRIVSNTDDSTNGFSVGSLWVYTNKMYVCTDSTPNNAVWKIIGGNVNISSGSNKINVNNDTNGNIIIDLTESNININNLSGLPSGDIVGTNDTQILTNKTIDASNNTIIISITNNEIKADAEIDATKIANSSVSNTEFQHLRCNYCDKNIINCY